VKCHVIHTFLTVQMAAAVRLFTSG